MMADQNGATQDGATRLHPDIRAALQVVADRLRAAAAVRLPPGTEPDPFRGLHLDPDSVLRAMAQPGPGASAGAADNGQAALPGAFALPRALDPSPLGRLTRVCRLRPFDVAVVALCLLAEIDPSCGTLVAFVHDDVTRKQPSVQLALALFASSDDEAHGCLRAFHHDAPLRDWQLVHLGPDELLLRQSLRLDRAVLWHLLGEHGLEPELEALARPYDEDVGADYARLAPLDALVARGVDGAQEERAGPPPLLLHGSDEQVCIETVAAATRRAGRRMLVIDGARLTGLETGAATLRRLLREAALIGALPCVTNAATLLRDARADLYRRQLQAFQRPLILTARSDDATVGFAGDALLPLHVPVLGVAQRLAQWREAIAAHGVAAVDGTLLVLAEATTLSGGAIDAVAALARTTASADGQPADDRALQQSAHAVLYRTAHSLTLVTPRFGWDDIVLPPDRLQALRHLCSRVRHRSLVRQGWGVGPGSPGGVVALFAGEPGTGKSMAADIIAADLGLDLCRIDLSQTVSKYIGETEKSLARIFDEAERCGAVLVFDEADALFGKRSSVRDSHDRYANIEVSYLLQRVEGYRGLALLTTNLRANLDPAFTRRIAAIVDFPRPEPPDRLRLWHRALANVPRAEPLPLEELAQRLEVSGGVIMNVALTAAHFAADEGGVLTRELLLRAAQWEVQKLGRLMDAELLGVPSRDNRAAR